MTESKYSKAARDRWAKVPVSERSKIASVRARQRWDKLTPEERSIQASKGAATRYRNK